MNNEVQSTARLAGFLMVFSFVFFLIHIVVDMTHGVKLPSMFMHCLYSLIISAYGLALCLVFRKFDPILPAFVGLWFAAQGLFLLLQGCIVLSGLVFPENFSFIPTTTSSEPLSSLEVAMNKIGRTGYICQGLAVLTLAVLILRTEAVTRWVGWLGMVAGVLSLLFGLTGMAGLLNDTASAVSFLLLSPIYFSFVLILGCKLFSGNVNEPAASS